MGKLDAFKEIVRADVPMASLTWLRMGGPIEYLAEPRSEKELVGLLKACAEDGIDVRALGDGSNLLVSDAGAPGLAIKLSNDAFCKIDVDAPYVTAGAGAKLGRLATATASAGLGGLESMAGIPGAVGAALVSNVSSRDAALEQYVDSVRVVTYDGEIVDASKDELVFGRRSSNLENTIVLSVKFKLTPDAADDLVKRLQKIWIVRKKNRPEVEQGGFARMFQDPQGCSAAELIDEMGFAGAKIGRASVCEADANLIVAEDGCSAEDVKRLMALIEAKVSESAGIKMERELKYW